MSIRPRQVVSTASGRGLVAGLGSLVVVSALYPVIADSTERPLSAFALPPLLTAVLSGWRQTVFVGVLGLGIAATIGVAGPLDAPALLARLVIIGLAAASGALGARFREQQQVRLHDLSESASLLRAFERSLAPDPDAPPGYAIAVRYAASERHMDIGGDFVDAVGLADGRLAVVIGDVCGHGPSEAAYGTALRAAWRTIVLTHPVDPIEWLRRLDATFFVGGGPDAYVTLCTGVIDRRTREAILVSAGHPWPVALGTTTGVIAMPAGAPLGLGPRGWTATTVSMGPRGLLLYSDGLIENPRSCGPPDRWGEDGLVEWLQGRWPSADVEEMCDLLMAAALDDRQHRDDVAAMIISFTDPLPVLETASREAAAAHRRALAGSTATRRLVRRRP